MDQGSGRKVLFVAHVGKTYGHLVRALAVADELHARGETVEIVASARARALLDSWPIRYVHRPVPWEWSHNDAGVPGPREEFTRSVAATAKALLAELRSADPALVVGFPGVFSTQVARALAVPHVSVLHAPYLWPRIALDDPSPAEAAVEALARRVTDETFTTLMQSLAIVPGLAPLTYSDYLDSEHILVPQPRLPLRGAENVHEFEFIRASYGHGEPPPGLDPASTCYVTFGSGNPCDLEEVVAAARAVFPQVLVTGWPGRTGEVAPGIFASAAIPSAEMTGRAAVVVSHGGIGTVGTFAETRTPQVVVPTEIDQATMAIHATRGGIARAYGLDEWARAPRLGRRLVPIDGRRLAATIDAAAAAPPRQGTPAGGAAGIADHIVGLVRRTGGAGADAPPAVPVG